MKIILTILKYILIFLTSIVCYFILLAICIIIFLSVIGFFRSIDERYQEQWDNSVEFDHKSFPSLSEPIFYFTRRDGGDSGAWVVVYSLNVKAKQEFLQKWQEDVAESVKDIECIKPTIKKRWRTWRSNIHYVQPSEFFRHHQDFKRHDSFIVFRSERYIKNIEIACQAAMFKKLEQAAPRYGKAGYWAIAEEHNLLFSVKYFD